MESEPEARHFTHECGLVPDPSTILNLDMENDPLQNSETKKNTKTILDKICSDFESIDVLSPKDKKLNLTNKVTLLGTLPKNSTQVKDTANINLTTNIICSSKDELLACTTVASVCSTQKIALHEGHSVESDIATSATNPTNDSELENCTSIVSTDLVSTKADTLPMQQCIDLQTSGILSGSFTDERILSSLGELADAEIVQTGDNSVSIVISNPRLIEVLRSSQLASQTSISVSETNDSVPETISESVITETSFPPTTSNMEENLLKNLPSGGDEIIYSDHLKDGPEKSGFKFSSTPNASTSKGKMKSVFKMRTNKGKITKARRVSAKMKTEWTKLLSKRGSLMCPMQGCSQIFVTVTNFVTHYKFCPGQEDLQHCPYCSSVIFSSHKAVLHHMEVEHPEKAEEYKSNFLQTDEVENSPESISGENNSEQYVEISQKPIKIEKQRKFFSKGTRLSPRKKTLKQKIKSIQENVIENIKEFKKCVRFDNIVSKISSYSGDELKTPEVLQTTVHHAVHSSADDKSPRGRRPRINYTNKVVEKEKYFEDVDESLSEKENSVCETPITNTKSRLVLDLDRYKRYNEVLTITRDWSSERRTYSSKPRQSDSSLNSSISMASQNDFTASSIDIHQLGDVSMQDNAINEPNPDISYVDLTTEGSSYVPLLADEKMTNDKSLNNAFSGRPEYYFQEMVAENEIDPKDIAYSRSDKNDTPHGVGVKERIPCYLKDNFASTSSVVSRDIYSSKRKQSMNIRPVITYGINIPLDVQGVIIKSEEKRSVIDFDTFVKDSIGGKDNLMSCKVEKMAKTGLLQNGNEISRMNENGVKRPRVSWDTTICIGEKKQCTSQKDKQQHFLDQSYTKNISTSCLGILKRNKDKARQRQFQNRIKKRRETYIRNIKQKCIRNFKYNQKKIQLLKKLYSDKVMPEYKDNATNTESDALRMEICGETNDTEKEHVNENQSSLNDSSIVDLEKEEVSKNDLGQVSSQLVSSDLKLQTHVENLSQPTNLDSIEITTPKVTEKLTDHLESGSDAMDDTLLSSEKNEDGSSTAKESTTNNSNQSHNLINVSQDSDVNESSLDLCNVEAQPSVTPNNSEKNSMNENVPNDITPILCDATGKIKRPRGRPKKIVYSRKKATSTNVPMQVIEKITSAEKSHPIICNNSDNISVHTNITPSQEAETITSAGETDPVMSNATEIVKRQGRQKITPSEASENINVNEKQGVIETVSSAGQNDSVTCNDAINSKENISTILTHETEMTFVQESNQVTSNATENIKRQRGRPKKIVVVSKMDGIKTPDTQSVTPVRKSERMKKSKTRTSTNDSSFLSEGNERSINTTPVVPEKGDQLRRKRGRPRKYPPKTVLSSTPESSVNNLDPKMLNNETNADTSGVTLRKCPRKSRPRKCLNALNSPGIEKQVEDNTEKNLEETNPDLILKDKVERDKVEKVLELEKMSTDSSSQVCTCIKTEKVARPSKRRRTCGAVDAIDALTPCPTCSSTAMLESLEDKISRKSSVHLTENEKQSTQLSETPKTRKSASRAKEFMTKILKSDKKNVMSETENKVSTFEGSSGSEYMESDDSEEDQVIEKKQTKSSKKEISKSPGVLHSTPQRRDHLGKPLPNVEYFSDLLYEDEKEVYQDLLPINAMFQALSGREYEECLPPMDSISIKIETSVKGVTDWMKLKCFDSINDGGAFKHYTFFTGGPVSSSAFCPTPSNKICTQYIALGTCNNVFNFHSYVSTTPQKGLIQIWNLGHLQSASSGRLPQMEFAIPHDHGTIMEMQWCPRGCWQSMPFPHQVSNNDVLPRLGLLAVACSDSFVRIYSVPHPNFLPKSDSDFPIYASSPSVILKPLCGGPGLVTRKSMATCLQWSRTDSCEKIACGYGSGLVCIWLVNTTNGILLNKENDIQKTITPYLTFQAHGTPVTSLSFAPLQGCRWLVTSGYDKTLKFFDLMDTSMPFCSVKRGFARNCQWTSDFCGAFASLHDGVTFKGSNFFKECGIEEFSAQNVSGLISSLTQSSISEVMNAVASADMEGEVTVSLVRKKSLYGEQMKLPVYCSYKIFKTEVVPLQISSEILPNVPEDISAALTEMLDIVALQNSSETLPEVASTALTEMVDVVDVLNELVTNLKSNCVSLDDKNNFEGSMSETSLEVFDGKSTSNSLENASKLPEHVSETDVIDLVNSLCECTVNSVDDCSVEVNIREKSKLKNEPGSSGFTDSLKIDSCSENSVDSMDSDSFSSENFESDMECDGDSDERLNLSDDSMPSECSMSSKSSGCSHLSENVSDLIINKDSVSSKEESSPLNTLDSFSTKISTEDSDERTVLPEGDHTIDTNSSSTKENTKTVEEFLPGPDSVINLSEHSKLSQKNTHTGADESPMLTNDSTTVYDSSTKNIEPFHSFYKPHTRTSRPHIQCLNSLAKIGDKEQLEVKSGNDEMVIDAENEKCEDSYPSCTTSAATHGVVFKDVDLGDKAAYNPNDVEEMDKPFVYERNNLSAVNTIAWNPNYGCHFWLFTAGNSGVARLCCLSELVDEDNTSPTKKDHNVIT